MKLLFDLGGVFFDWNPKYFYKSIFKSEKEMDYFLKEICNDEWNLKQDAGRSIEEAEKMLIDQFPNYEVEIKLYYQNHRLMIKGVYQDSVDLLYELKSKKFKCYVLSNWSAETFHGMMEEYTFLQKFDGLIISGNEKLVKPDKGIFKLAITRFNLIPKQTIFIDDRIENIQAAKKINFLTVHLEDPYKIKKDIYKYINN